MITAQDKTFLRRAMRLAMNGRGHVEPNPMVGCVLVKNDQVIGEGWHKKYGQAHAEPTALNDCRERGNDPAGATAYVTLEPCCHTNKQTPPCAPRLIEAKIARVVIGCLDPNPDVNGKGVAMLREAGIEVDCLSGARNPSPLPLGEGKGEGLASVDRQSTTHALTPTLSQGERELDASHFEQLIAPFTLRQTHKRPYVTLKWAQSSDRKIAGPDGVRMQISNSHSQQLVHQLRSRCDAIIVGAATVAVDDPLLTARVENPPRTPERIVVDRMLRVSLAAKIINSIREAPTVLVVDEHAKVPKGKVNALFDAGVRLVWPGQDRDFLRAALTNGDLVARPFTHVMVESGKGLALSFFAAGYVDRVWLFRSQMTVGSSTAPSAADVPPHFLPVATLNLAGDVLTEYLNTQSPAFFAPAPSADFVLAQEDVARAGEGFPFTPGT